MNNVSKICLFVSIIISFNSLNAQRIDTLGINKLLNSTVKKSHVYGLQLTVKKGDDVWTSGRGGLINDKQFFIASTTKLYVTAIILKLKEQGKLSLEDSIHKYLSNELISNLHKLKGIEYSKRITIKNLLAHTSGLPDYFEDKNKDEKSLLNQLFEGNDKAWTFNESIEISKKLEPKFKPNKKGKAHYSDTNFQLLGKIIETITGKSFNSALDEFIIKPLKLEKTYIYFTPSDTLPSLIYYKDKPLNIPKAMSSFGPDGGIVSTSKELSVFVSAFFTGKLFPKSYLAEMKEYNSIMFPLQNGVGMMRFKLPGTPEFIGHSGLSGAFAYYVPKKDLFLTGTVNQLHKPGTSYQLMTKLLRFVK